MIRDPAIPKLLSLAETGTILGCSRQYVHILVKDDKLPAAIVGGFLVLSEATVRQYAEGHTSMKELVGGKVKKQRGPRGAQA